MMLAIMFGVVRRSRKHDSHMRISVYWPNEKDRIMRRSAGFGLNIPCLSRIPSHFLGHVPISTPFDGRGIKLIGWSSHYQFRRAVERVGTGTWEDAEKCFRCDARITGSLYRSKAEPAGQPYMDGSRTQSGPW